MANIISVTTTKTGEVGIAPRRVEIVTTDSLAVCTAAAWFNPVMLQGYTIYPTDIIDMVYSYSTVTKTGTYIELLTSITNGAITFVQKPHVIANTTASYAGGGTSNTFAAVGLTVASKGSAVIRASTNSVSITKALPGTDTLAITFSADPGASTTVDYIYSSVAQA